MAIEQTCSARSKAVQERAAVAAYIDDAQFEGYALKEARYVATTG
jgi:hypothetical protein